MNLIKTQVWTQEGFRVPPLHLTQFDAKGAFSFSKSKDLQHNGQTKKDKKRSTKLKIKQHKSSYNWRCGNDTNIIYYGYRVGHQYVSLNTNNTNKTSTLQQKRSR